MRIGERGKGVKFYRSIVLYTRLLYIYFTKLNVQQVYILT